MQIQQRSRREEPTTTINPFRQKSFALFHNKSAAYYSNGVIIKKTLHKKSGSEPNLITTSQNVNETNNRSSNNNSSEGNRINEEYENKSHYESNDVNENYDSDDGDVLLLSKKLLNHEPLFVHKSSSGNRTSLNNRSTTGVSRSGIIIRRNIATEVDSRRTELANDTESDQIGEDKRDFYFVESSSRRRFQEISRRYSYLSFQRHKSAVATSAAPSLVHSKSSTRADRHALSHLQQAAAKKPNSSRPKTVSTFFMRPVKPGEKDEETAATATNQDTEMFTNINKDRLADMNRASSNTLRTIKKMSRLKSSKPSTKQEAAMVSDLEAEGSAKTRLQTTSDLNMKKFKNLEQFYVKKMNEFGFEDLSYKSTNKLLSRSDPNYSPADALVKRASSNSQVNKKPSPLAAPPTKEVSFYELVTSHKDPAQRNE